MHQGQRCINAERASTPNVQGRTCIEAEHASRPDLYQHRTRINAGRASSPNVQGRTRINAERARPNVHQGRLSAGRASSELFHLIKAEPDSPGAVSSRPNSVHPSFCIKAERASTPNVQGRTRIKAECASRPNMHQGQSRDIRRHFIKAEPSPSELCIKAECVSVPARPANHEQAQWR